MELPYIAPILPTAEGKSPLLAEETAGTYNPSLVAELFPEVNPSATAEYNPLLEGVEVRPVTPTGKAPNTQTASPSQTKFSAKPPVPALSTQGSIPVPPVYDVLSSSQQQNAYNQPQSTVFQGKTPYNTQLSNELVNTQEKQTYQNYLNNLYLNQIRQAGGNASSGAFVYPSSLDQVQGFTGTEEQLNSLNTQIASLQNQLSGTNGSILGGSTQATSLQNQTLLQSKLESAIAQRNNLLSKINSNPIASYVYNNAGATGGNIYNNIGYGSLSAINQYYPNKRTQAFFSPTQTIGNKSSQSQVLSALNGNYDITQLPLSTLTALYNAGLITAQQYNMYSYGKNIAGNYSYDLEQQLENGQQPVKKREIQTT